MAQPYYPPPRTIRPDLRPRIITPPVVPATVVTGAAALTGAGTSTTVALRVATGVAALTGLGSSTTVATRTKLGVAALTGTGTSTTAGVRKAIASAALTGAGSSTTAGLRKQLAAVALTGLGSTLQVGFAKRFAQSSMTGAGTLSATAIPNLPVTDTFTRTQSSWGPASDSGHIWVDQTDGGAFSSSTDGSQGLMPFTGDANYRREQLNIQNQDIGVLFRVGFTATTTGATIQAGTQLRQTGPPTVSAYYCFFTLTSAGVLGSQISLLNVGGGSVLASNTVTSSYVAGDYYWLRAQAVGSAIRMRVWKDGTGEPSTWTFSPTNSTVASGAKFSLYQRASSGTVGTTSAKFDDFSAFHVVEGTAALTGTGTSSVAGFAKKFATAPLTGAGTSSVTGTRKAFTSAVLTGAGTLGSTGLRIRLGVAPLTGTGTLTATGLRKRLGIAPLSGAGTLSATAATTATKQGAASLTGAGTLSSTATRKKLASVALTGLGSTLQTGFAKRFAQASPISTGVLTATPLRKTVGTTSLTGTGVLSATGFTPGVKTSSMAFRNTSLLVATATVPVIIPHTPTAPPLASQMV